MLEEKLDRIAIALEKLCALVAEMPKVETKAPATREKKEKVKETPAPLPVPQEVAPKASTPAASINPPTPAQPVAAPVPQMAAVAPVASTGVSSITVEQLRAAIIEVQQKKGPAIAKKIVQEVGNAPQVTKIEVSKYQMVMDACKAALNGQ